MFFKKQIPLLFWQILFWSNMSGISCTTVKSIFVADNTREQGRTIANPFGHYSSEKEPGDSIILRTKKGDSAVEIELPKSSQDRTDFVFPVSPLLNKHGFRSSTAGATPSSAFSENLGGSGTLLDSKYKDRQPSIADKEIVKNFTKFSPENSKEQTEIEKELGLILPEGEAPERSASYLAATDHIKQLYRLGRYEAALLELDDLIKQYPTDPKLHQMRGTLLYRIGQYDLAMKSWGQALRMEPQNESLRRFIERKQARKGIGAQ